MDYFDWFPVGSVFLFILIVVFVPWLIGVITIFRKLFAPKKKEGLSEASPLPKKSTDYEPVAHLTPPAPPVQKVAVADRFKSLENINILLYVGAFLVVAAAGIFVGFNYETLSASFKVVFLFVFTLIFYLVGLFLYLKTKNIKPAGVTFTTIGLLLAPLVGLAIYKFSYDGTNGQMIWFATSAVVLALYIITLAIIKQVYISYLTSFTALSLFQSSINLFDLPIYWLFWGMSILALIFALIAKIKKLDKIVADPLAVTSQIFLPISLAISANLIFSEGSSQFGINILLSGFFYLINSFLYEGETKSTNSFSLSLILFPIGLFSILIQDHRVDYDIIASLLVGLSVVYLVVYEVVKKYWHNEKTTSLMAIGGLVALLANLLLIEDPKILIFGLVLTILVNLYFFVPAKLYFNLILALVGVLSLPYAVFALWYVQNKLEVQSVCYLTIGVVILLAKWLTSKNLESQNKGILSIGYWVAILITFILASGDHQWFMVGVWLALTVMVFAASYVEGVSLLLPISMIFYISALNQICNIFLVSREFYPLIMLGGALIIFAISFLLDEKRNKVLSYTALIPAFWGVFYYLLGDSESSSWPILSLFLAGGLVLAVFYRYKNFTGQAIGTAVMLVAINWYLKFLGEKETQVYTLIWTAYFAVLAYLSYLQKKRSNQDLFTIAALGFLTIPLLFQAMGDESQWYGLMLGVEGILLILVGIALHYKLIRTWGIVALVIIVLDQMRDYLLEIPQWIIIGGVGITLLAGAIVLLARRKEE